MTAVIADDEPAARAGLRDIIAGIEWLRVIGEASNGPAAIEMINRLKPELVFLDIQMPGLLGTDVLRHIDHRPFVIFTTAYAQHAATAFELGAIDYVLKPFGADRLSKSLERVRSAIGEPVTPSAIDRLRETLGTGPMSRLFVRSGNNVIPVPVNSISWFEADGDYVVAHTDTARHMLHLSLNRLETRLDPKKFVRIHRAHIVNMDRVTAFRRQDRTKLVAEMSDGTRLAVSRERAKEIREAGV